MGDYKIEKLEYLPHHEAINKALENDLHLDEFQCILPNQIIQEAYKSLVKRYDNFVFEQFKKVGYSHDEVLRLADEGRLTGENVGLYGTFYYLDGELLLKIDRMFSPLRNNNDTYFCCEYRVVCTFANGTTAIMQE